MAAYAQLVVLGDDFLSLSYGNVTGLSGLENCSRQLRELEESGWLEHGVNVGRLSEMIARAEGLSLEKQKETANCGLHHDKCKHEGIYSKQGELDPEEKCIARTHARQIYDEMPWLDPDVKKAIGGSHDTRMVIDRRTREMSPEELDIFIGCDNRDGERRVHDPDGGKKRRIITLADVYSALTEIREYRFPMIPEQALKYIESDYPFPEVGSLRKVVEDIHSPIILR